MESEESDWESPLNHPIIHFLLSISYLFVFLACILGNLVILLVFLSQRRARSVPNFFLANLTIADLCVGIFCVLQNAAHFVILDHGHWPFGKVLCHCYIYTLHLIPNVSAGILVLVSVERLVAVLRPLRVRRAFPRRVLISSSAFVWIASSVMNLPYYYSSQFIVIQDPERNESYPLCTRKHTELYGLNVLKFVATMNFIVWYVTPLMILLCIYATIGIVVGRAASLTKASANKLLPLRGSEKSKPMPGWRSESSAGGVSVEKRRKVGRLAIGIVLSFALLTLPRYVYSMWSLWRDPTSPRCLNCWQTVVQPISFLLMFFNSALNPVMYAFLSVRFRQCIKDTFGCNNKARTDAALELSSRFHRNRFGRGLADLRSGRLGATQPISEADDTAYDDS